MTSIGSAIFFCPSFLHNPICLKYLLRLLCVNWMFGRCDARISCACVRRSRHNEGPAIVSPTTLCGWPQLPAYKRCRANVTRNWSTLFHRSRWIVDYIIRSHSLGLATQYLFVTLRNRKIIVTDRKGWKLERTGCEMCDRGGSLSYIDWCVVFSSQVARLELYIEIASVGADIGNWEERVSETARFEGEEKRSLSP